MKSNDIIKDKSRKGIDEIVDKNNQYHVWTVGAERDNEQLEWSYSDIHDIAVRDGFIEENELYSARGNKRTFVDRRYIDKNNKYNVSVLVEVKSTYKLTEEDERQLFAYAKLERCVRRGVKIICVLTSTKTGECRVWKYDGKKFERLNDTQLKSYEEYVEYFANTRSVSNNRFEVLKNATVLNRKLHNLGIKENVRCPYVALLMFALKNSIKYAKLNDVGAVEDRTIYTTGQIYESISNLIDTVSQKNCKIDGIVPFESDKIKSILDIDIIKAVDRDDLVDLLNYLERDVMAHIDDTSSEGMDILSHFLLVFLKYVNREDKNQAFTPGHIAHFMCRLARINRNSKVLDPTCGSGTFLINAMNLALSKCETNEERLTAKKNIMGVEIDENVYKIATANMLTHSGGFANIVYGSCLKKKDAEFDKDGNPIPDEALDIIKKFNADVILMNPPYNASKGQVPADYSSDWGDKVATDPTKGLRFVKRIADVAKKGATVVALLPQQCAIGKTEKIQTLKTEILSKHTLKAVFTMPNDLFYPGASAVVCCMVLVAGIAHADNDPDDQETFLGFYKNDGFEKRKHLGRIDVNDIWNDIENEWVSLYFKRIAKPGMSVLKKLTDKDEWCAEAHMDTDYSVLTDSNFEAVVRNFLAYQIQNVTK